jgi:hypothetical protein
MKPDVDHLAVDVRALLESHSGLRAEHKELVKQYFELEARVRRLEDALLGDGK